MRNTPQRQQGVAAVELALLLTPLILLAFGITEYGRAFHDYNKIAKSCRDATRYLSTQAPGDGASIAVAKNLVVYGSTTNNGEPLVTGLSTGNVSVCDSSNCRTDHYLQSTGVGSSNVNLVTVTVSGFNFTSIAPAVVSNLTFGAISVTMGQVL